MEKIEIEDEKKDKYIEMLKKSLEKAKIRVQHLEQEYDTVDKDLARIRLERNDLRDEAAKKGIGSRYQ
eukprot:CAMPEP_0176357538 /NCGR_PEP_ID=MMETSP0126-20121128/14848_1 /TAXON_ID=141414 ORGANISM="Strombidinopsis acuminatum, Strain SPMC142" /NCGR_SAMPLE_ID=MMETSP0126 /ASSEMBLY_ACC=CAM_ASM_000229 /LENGTH=67 /DNA_ID=CAMNT_0017711195 /DNA_START=532 /DNA_END=735 /DNA_ORIENTATION=+